MNQSSNSNMARSTAEAIKQIQKQGLSISVVMTDSRPSFPSESPVSKEAKVKLVPIDKTPKTATRPVTLEKPVFVPTRLAPATSPEARTSVGQSAQQTSQPAFQDSKNAVSKSNQPLVASTPEARAFGNQSWSNPATSSSDSHSSKPQGISRASHMISVVPEKNPIVTRVSQNSMFTENKLPVTRVVPVSHESKTPVRGVQMPTLASKTPLNRSQNQQHILLDVRAQKSPLGSPPPEVKVFSGNQVRPSKVYTTPVHENKGVSFHNVSSPADMKALSNSSKVISRGVEKTVMIQRNLTVKGKLTDKNSQVKADFRSTGDQLAVVPLATLDSSKNSVKVASTPQRKTPKVSEEKSAVKISKISMSAENQTVKHLKTSLNSCVQSESKTVSQAVKFTSIPSDISAQKHATFENSNDLPATPVMSNPPSRGTAKRPLVTKVSCRLPVPKKKCPKRSADEQIGVSGTSEPCSFSSDEGSPTKEKKFFKIKSASDLTITPVGNPTASTPGTSGASRTPSGASRTPSGASRTPNSGHLYGARCHACKLLSSNLSDCENCSAKITSTAMQYPKKVRGGHSYVVTKNITTSIKKQIIYTTIPADGLSENQSYHFKQAVEGQVRIEGNQVISPRTKGRQRGRRKLAEPECYTLSSDEDDNASMQFNPMLDDSSHHESQMYQGESDGSNLEHSSGSEAPQDENEEMDDPQFPGVTGINEDGEEMEYEGEEGMGDEEGGFSEEDEEADEEEEESPHDDSEIGEDRSNQKPTEYPIRCRSIRIGSYKVHPQTNSPFVPVTLSNDSISFSAPVINQPSRIMSIRLRDHDIRNVMVHFGRCLPIMFIFTSTSFGEAVRNALNMSDKDPRYFDPNSKDEKTQKLTFIIESITEDQRNFIRSTFPGEKKLREMDQKVANEMLVKSTPHQHTAVKLQSVNPVLPISVETLQPLTQNNTPQVTATKIISRQPVVNLFTYPPPPQTGGIAITNEDLACLNEGEFLNDAIIDFYLKYVFYEKLSPSQREKTHIFSSYFYPRLTHKPERPRSKEDATKTMQVRRHEQVKTWTRHVDIFSKDFIIIPVNQNVHWFLAIICFPGRVPEAPEEPVTPKSKGIKSMDNVTSTVEQEEVHHKVIIKEISPNGDNSDVEENSNSLSDSSYQVEEPPDSDEPSAESPDSTTHPDVKKRDLPCICIFDSLCGSHGRWRIASTLREYLEMEWKVKKGTRKVFDRNTMQGFIMKCPQQTNYTDCGTYVLQYVESFFENPIQFFRAPMPDLTNWFSEAKVSKKRQQLQELLLSLQKKLAKTNLSNSNIRKPNQNESVPSSPATHLQTENR